MTWEGRLTFEVSRSEPDADVQDWVDFTGRVRDEVQPVTVGAGVQTDLGTAEPGRLGLRLANEDDALTFGNPSSPYAWWGPGRRVRLRDRVGSSIVDLFHGYLEMPQETHVTEGVEGWVTVTAVDLLGRLETAPVFISTLAEYIRHTHRVSLGRYWPLAGEEILYGRTTYPDLVAGKTLFATRGGTAGEFQPGDGVLAPGDDLRAPLFTPAAGGGWSLLSTDVALPLPAGQVLTAVAWLRPIGNFGATTGDLLNLAIVEDGGTSSLALYHSSGTIRAQLAFGALAGTIDTGLAVPTEAPVQVAVRYGYSPSVFEVWVGSRQHAGVLTGTPPATSTAIQLAAGSEAYGGRIGHVQLHVDNADAFDFAHFQAQRQAGLLGLERQTTGDRVRTILGYAGVPAEVYANTVDRGQTVMQATALAGAGPLTALREAERTEQGLLYVDGSGRVVFLDRRSLYNI